MRRRYPVAEDLPPCGDPLWEEWAKPLVPFLKVARDWSELREWARREGVPDMVLRNLLAWLSVQGAVEAAPITREGRTEWLWMLRAPEVSEEDESAAPVACWKCGGMLREDFRCVLCGSSPRKHPP